MKDQPSNKAPNQQLQQQSKQQNTQQQQQKQKQNQQSKKNQPNQQKQKQQPKKKKNASTTSIPNMLHYHRINFLYQASHLLMNTHMQMKEQEQLYASLTEPATTTTTIETNKSNTCLNESNHGGGNDDDDVPMTSVEEETTETETEPSVQHQHTILNAKQVSQHYSRTLSKISAKNVLRLHSDMKRTLCKKCHLLLIAGETCSVRISNKRNRCYMIVTCGQCGTFRRYMLNDGNQKKKQTTTTKKQATNIINNEQQQGSTSTSDAQNVLSSNSTGESMITTE